jgi:hypothetical protein
MTPTFLPLTPDEEAMLEEANKHWAEQSADAEPSTDDIEEEGDYELEGRIHSDFMDWKDEQPKERDL